MENVAAVIFAQGGFGGAFGVGHHACDVAFLIADAGDVGAGTIGVGVIGEVAFGIDCSGSGCGSMLAANPCTSVQSFNVFFDG